jgi:hypothetical protein
VLAFTPEVEYALDWFDRTHELARTGTGLEVRRVALPRRGGMADQDPRLMEQLAVVAAATRAGLSALRQAATEPPKERRG